MKKEKTHPSQVTAKTKAGYVLNPDDLLTVTYQANEAIMFYRGELNVQGCHKQEVSGKQHT
jgi:hypothetical protein